MSYEHKVDNVYVFYNKYLKNIILVIFFLHFFFT